MAEDVQAFNIVQGDLVTLPNYLHKFKLKITAILPDIYGWVKLVGVLVVCAND